MTPQCFILDVDGVMTTGQFFYSPQGKVYKVFGPDDADALKHLNKHLPIRFVSADKRGFEISKKRIEIDMGFPLDLVASEERLAWIKSSWPLDQVIYMGDGLVDAPIFREVGYSIAPANAFYLTAKLASYVTHHRAGDRAVAEAAVHVANRFFAAEDLASVLRWPE